MIIHVNNLLLTNKIIYHVNNKLFLKGFLGCFSMNLPSFYFIKNEENKISYLFLSKFLFLSFLGHIKVILKKLTKIYYAKFRLKGLGFRTFFFSYSLIYFFFNYSNYLYFYRPTNLFVKRFKKRFVLLSNDWFLLRLVSINLLLLKKKGPYNLRGIKMPRQLYILKKSGKKI